MPREIIQFQCHECKNRNYSKTKNKKTTTERIGVEEVLPVLPEASAAPRNEVDLVG